MELNLCIQENIRGRSKKSVRMRMCMERKEKKTMYRGGAANTSNSFAPLQGEKNRREDEASM
jgi:hypothetical protein